MKHNTSLFTRFGAVAALLAAAATVSAQTPNNDCASATVISNGTHNGTTLDATQDGTGSCDVGLSLDVWYRYTAGVNGTLTVSTCNDGQTWDGALAIWNACPRNGGAPIACNDDGTGCGERSRVSAPITFNQVYYIRVTGNNGESGPFTLAVSSQSDGSGNGPDVVYSGLAGSIAHYGPVGGIHAYFPGSNTCNIGNQNLNWGNSWGGTPSLAANAFRLHDGRLLQIGQSWVKKACCAASSPNCGMSCNGAGGSVLGAGCMDTYGSGYNGSHGVIANRSGINAFTGAHTLGSSLSGNDIFRRLQVAQTDMMAANFPGAIYFIEGVYVGADDAAAGNAMNNASYQRVTIDGSYNMAGTGPFVAYQPAINAWRANGLGVGVADPSVILGTIDIPNEGRFHIARKVRDLGNGVWRYDFAIYNLNSDRSGGSLSIPLPAGTTVTNAGFHDVNYHSGEPYDNTDWTITVGANSISWNSPQTHAQNVNSNALRWGTMYNFWFDANLPPRAGNAEFGLFKPHTPQSVQYAVAVPTRIGDLNNDGTVSNFDIDPFVLALTDPTGYLQQFPGGNINAADVNNDGVVNNFDIDPMVDLLTN